MKLEEISRLISVRNYLETMVNGISRSLDKQDVNKAIKKIHQIDQKIIECSLLLDLKTLESNPVLEDSPIVMPTKPVAEPKTGSFRRASKETK